jgi:hypothetical protein
MTARDQLVAWPPEWEAVLDDIAADPTNERWNALHRFASGAAIYDWRRLALQKLRDRGVDPIALFRFASSGGVIPDCVEEPNRVQRSKHAAIALRRRVPMNRPGYHPCFQRNLEFRAPERLGLSLHHAARSNHP